MDGTYLSGQQKLTAKLEGRRYDYDQFTDLDHDEYLADIALRWKLTSLLDGTFDARQERAMAPFTLGNSSELTINVDRKINGLFNLNFNPDWRLEAGAYSHDLKSPLQFYPDFVEREFATHVGLINTSQTNLTYGITADHIAGRYENAPDAGPYSQTTASLTMQYGVSALTKFNGSVGYSRRDQVDTVGSVPAFIGSIGYTRQLTGRTSLNIQLSRAVNSYVAAAGSEIDTGANVGVNWQATYRITVALYYGLVHSAFVGQAIANSPGSNTNGRVDRLPTESVNVNYLIMQRLQLHAYLVKTSRTSDIESYHFSDSTAGIEAKLSWR